MVTSSPIDAAHPQLRFQALSDLIYTSRRACNSVFPLSYSEIPLTLSCCDELEALPTLASSLTTTLTGLYYIRLDPRWELKPLVILVGELMACTKRVLRT